MKRLSLLLLPMTLALPLLAQAQDAASSGNAREWLELQKSGSAASPVARPLPGEIAERSYQRYAESFSQPIPKTLEREGFLSQGGGGGSGGGK